MRACHAANVACTPLAPLFNVGQQAWWCKILAIGTSQPKDNSAPSNIKLGARGYITFHRKWCKILAINSTKFLGNPRDNNVDIYICMELHHATARPDLIIFLTSLTSAAWCSAPHVEKVLYKRLYPKSRRPRAQHPRAANACGADRN